MLRMVLSMHTEDIEIASVTKITQLEEAFLLRFLATAKRLGLVK